MAWRGSALQVVLGDLSSLCRYANAGATFPTAVSSTITSSITPIIKSAGMVQHLQFFRRAFSASTSSLPKASSAARVPRPRPPGFRGLLHDYKQLSKHRLSLLVASTATAGFIAGSGDTIDWQGLLWTSVGTFCCAASANSLNQLYEVGNDALMKRTAQRPLVTGMLSKRHAAAFALVSGVLGVGLLHSQTNAMTAGLGASNIALYAGIYTPLKQLTVANTWVGAVVGAIPPLMGWAAAAEGRLEPGAWGLAAALFCWQMPHFFALSWLCKEDYARGGFRMLPSIDLSGRRTALVALRHSLYLIPIGAAMVAAGVASEPLVWESAALAGALAVASTRFLASPSTPTARVLFRSSLLYLPVLMVCAIVHRKPNRHDVSWEMVHESLAARLPVAAAPALAAAVAAGKATALALCDSALAVSDVVLSLLPSTSMQCPSKAYSESEEEDALVDVVTSVVTEEDEDLESTSE